VSDNSDCFGPYRNLSESLYEHVIDVSFERVDIVGWLFSLPDEEYRRCCLPDHIACGLTSTDWGQAMCVGVETIGEWLMVHRYAAHIHRPDRCELVSLSDVFVPQGGRTKAQVTWTMSAEALADEWSKYTNSLAVAPSADFVRLLGNSGVAMMPSVISDHTRRETPRFADSVARYSLGETGDRPRTES
jgi:hypothetical protein